MERVVIKRNWACILALFALIALPAGAAILRPNAPPPIARPSETQINAARKAEQARAPLLSATAPAPEATYPGKGQINLGSMANPAALARALAVHSASHAAPGANKGESGRTRGIVMMISAAACMLGLSLGRVVANTLAQSTAGEADKAVGSNGNEDRSRSLGGGHRDYIID